MNIFIVIGLGFLGLGVFQSMGGKTPTIKLKTAGPAEEKPAAAVHPAANPNEIAPKE